MATWRERWAAKGLTPTEDGVYRYCDSAGLVCFEKLRWALVDSEGSRVDKTFTVRHRPRPASEPFRWASGVGPYSYLLYRLPELLSALHDGTEVFLCEGEKDADRVSGAWGVAATSHHAGAAATKPVQMRPFEHAVAAGWKGWVHIAVDADLTGGYVGYANYLNLIRAGVDADRVCFWTSAVRKLHADMSDHIAAGFTVSELRPVKLSVLLKIWEAMRRSGRVGNSQFGSGIGVTVRESHE